MMISKAATEELKRNITPAQAIEYYTGTTGRRGKYLCPFHGDTNPSITVKGNRWTCWACGAKGDIIDFTQRFHSIGFRDAVAKLGSDFGVQVIEKPMQTKAEREQVRWDRIAWETDKENRRQVRDYLDYQIGIYNTAHRVLYARGADADILKQYEEEIDWLIKERSAFGEIDHTAFLTPYERELMIKLKEG